ncbi:MAG: NTP transferase domain-containing protein [Balneolaceae bacterium]|nr:NTP transferase domain-containing protein [Balneolaceae bacterium]
MKGHNRRRTGVILAAGFGSRLKGTVDDVSLKPLTPVAGVPLIHRVFASLETAGCSRIVVVLGHGHEKVKKEITEHYDGPLDLVFVYNEDYHLSNGISLLSASDYLSGEFVLTMADHIVSDSIMEKARYHSPPNDGATLMVDYKIDTIFDLDDATKVLEKDEKIVSIGKEIDRYNCIDTGVFVCTPGLLDVLEQVYREKGDASLSDGVQQLAKKGQMSVLDIEDAFWQDVDTPEMLEYAEMILLEEEQAVSS